MNPQKILDFPRIRQSFSYDCGAAVVQSILAYYGTDLRSDMVISACMTAKDHGTRPHDMVKVLESYGLTALARQYTITEVRACIDSGIPVIFDLQAWDDYPHTTTIKDWKNEWDHGHYVVAIGYDEDHMYFADPSSFYRTYLTFSELEDRWHDEETNEKKHIHFGIAVSGKNPEYTSDTYILMK